MALGKGGRGYPNPNRDRDRESRKLHPDFSSPLRRSRSVKYEEVYRREYNGMVDARRHLKRYFDFYNHHRPHSSLAGITPAETHASKAIQNAA